MSKKAEKLIEKLLSEGNPPDYDYRETYGVVLVWKGLDNYNLGYTSRATRGGKPITYLWTGSALVAERNNPTAKRYTDMDVAHMDSSKVKAAAAAQGIL